MLQFGYCSKPMTCQSRHILFKQIDEPGVNIPRFICITLISLIIISLCLSLNIEVFINN